MGIAYLGEGEFLELVKRRIDRDLSISKENKNILKRIVTNMIGATPEVKSHDLPNTPIQPL